MKFLLALVFVAMGLVGPVAASTVQECLFAGMDNEEELVPGATPPPPNQLDSMDCRKVDYTQSFGPVKPIAGSQPVNETNVVVPVPAAPQGQPQEQVQEAPAEEVGGISNTYNDRQLARIGELDAMQGRPLNMKYAENLDYLKGYTRGQQMGVKMPQQRGVGW